MGREEGHLMDAASIALSAAVAVCSWAEPGRDPYVGDVVAAVDRYRDVPAPVRRALQAVSPGTTVQRVQASHLNNHGAVHR